MIRRLRNSAFLLSVGIFLLPLLAFAASWHFCSRFTQDWTEIEPSQYFSLLFFTTIVWSVFSQHYKVTNIHELFREKTGARAAFSACTATYLAILASLFFYRSYTFSRSFLVVSGVVLLFSTFALRSVFRIWLRKEFYVANPVKILIVGVDEFARRAARRLERGPFACRIVGYVRIPDQEVRVSGAVVDLSDLSSISSSEIDDVVLALPPSEFSRIPELMNVLTKALCLPVRAIVDLGEGMVVRDKLFQFGRLQMLDLAATPAESLDYVIAKRVFDIGFSILVLVVCAPVFLVIAAAIKITSPGPIFFAQERVGLNGRIFKMFKFRTMKVAPQESSDTQWTVENDPRRTRVGKFLRKTSLDELPQFINVILGQMSVVGPRPERPHFVQQFLGDVARYNDRHRLKVGITGWAQVNGYRGDTSIQKRVEHDLYYLQNWSFGFDMRIIFMTILGGLVNKNAY